MEPLGRNSCALLLAALAACAANAARGEEVATPEAQTELVGPRVFRFVGSASCAASNCHGGNGARPVRTECDPLSPQAYSIWVERDPHSQAYAVLTEPRSERMSQRLGWGPATKAPGCLACHAVNPPASELTESTRHTVQDGVGCEACHGAAEAWLEPHKWATWSALPAADKQALGYRELRSAAERAGACADCHVGSAGKDVNHDLIAAGHPRMAFEFSAYHANLPKHWQREEIPADQIDAKFWLVGQAVSGERSAALLGQRAASPTAPWPELSEYDCFACHHDLADPSWRQAEEETHKGLPLGTARWGSWPFALIAVAAPEAPLGELRQEMERTLPRRDFVAKSAEAVRKDLAADVRDLQNMQVTAAERTAWLARLTAPDALGPAENWDSAAQRYLACAALNYAAQRDEKPESGGAARKIEDSLRQVRELLEFGEEGAGRRFDSPWRETTDRRQAIREAFEAIHRTTTAEGGAK